MLTQEIADGYDMVLRVCLTFQTPTGEGSGVGLLRGSAVLVFDFSDVQDEHVGSVLPRLGHSVEERRERLLNDTSPDFNVKREVA